jgi:hypothetical protein
MGISHNQAVGAALLCATLAFACPAGAQMYKWVDENGKVSYSNTPPPETAKKKVEAVAERVSVYTPDAQINKAMSEDARRDASRIASLERQLDAERAGRRTPAANPDTAARKAAAYDRCVAERRVDCEAIRSGTGGDAVYGYTGYYGPNYVVGARTFPPSTSFFVSNTPATPVGINPAPPVGISTAPKVGIDDRPGVGAPPRSSRPVSRLR